MSRARSRWLAGVFVPLYLGPIWLLPLRLAGADPAAPAGVDFTVSAAGVVFSTEELEADGAWSFRYTLEADLLRVAATIPGIASINVKSPLKFIDAFVLEVGFDGEYGVDERIAIHEEVRLAIEKRWYAARVDRNGFACIPEDPTCPPFPPYDLSTLILKYNFAHRPHRRIDVPVRNRGTEPGSCWVDLATREGSILNLRVTFVAGQEFILAAFWDESEGDEVTVALDPTNEVAETDEGNNTVTVLFRTGSTLFVRGDANDDGRVDIADSVASLQHQFTATSPLLCLKAADIDDDGAVSISDPIRELSYLFLGGPAPEAPYPGCGTDPTEDDLDCGADSACAD